MMSSGSQATVPCRWPNTWRRIRDPRAPKPRPRGTSLHAMGQLAENLARVRDRIEAACSRAGRNPDSVRLMAVTQTHAPEQVEMSYAAGVRLFGENRVHERAAKGEQVTHHPDLVWALIG